MKCRILSPRSGYLVTYHTSGSMTFKRFTRKYDATDSAYSHSVSHPGYSAVVEPANGAMRWGDNGMVRCLQFSTSIKGEGVCESWPV